VIIRRRVYLRVYVQHGERQCPDPACRAGQNARFRIHLPNGRPWESQHRLCGHRLHDGSGAAIAWCSAGIYRSVRKAIRFRLMGSSMTESSKAILQLRGIRKRFGSALVLDGIDIDVHQGELITFMGPSGCGKTTLLRVIGGFASPDEGRVLLDGNDSTEKPPYERDTAMVFQSYALFPHLSVADNVGYGLRIRGLPKSEIRERVDRLLALVQLQGSGGKSISQLSGGQQQRVALARAFSLEPKVLLLDEPLSNLDANLRLSMREEIRRLQKRLGLTTVLVTHDQYEAMSVSDRIVVMNHGRVQQIGAPVTIYEDPVNEFVADFVGGVNFVPARVESIAPDGKASLVRCALGRLHLDCRGRTL